MDSQTNQILSTDDKPDDDCLVVNGIPLPYTPNAFATIERTTTIDAVSHPLHYTAGDIECIDAIESSMNHEAFCGYLKGNVMKYMWRYNLKNNPVEDLKKARWYLDKLIDTLS